MRGRRQTQGKAKRVGEAGVGGRCPADDSWWWWDQDKSSFRCLRLALLPLLNRLLIPSPLHPEASFPPLVNEKLFRPL